MDLGKLEEMDKLWGYITCLNKGYNLYICEVSFIGIKLFNSFYL